MLDESDNDIRAAPDVDKLALYAVTLVLGVFLPPGLDPLAPLVLGLGPRQQLYHKHGEGGHSGRGPGEHEHPGHEAGPHLDLPPPLAWRCGREGAGAGI